MMDEIFYLIETLCKLAYKMLLTNQKDFIHLAERIKV